jgi:hypothetical protein
MSTPPLTADDLLARLPGSPDVYPQKLDLVRGAVLLLEFSASAYRAASFLDDRVLGSATRGGWVAESRVAEAAARVREPRPLHFVFHAGHVGSTLVSRLLDDTGAVLGLREPLPLRTLAEAHDVLAAPESLWSLADFDEALGTYVRLWSRGHAATRAVVLKATSTAGRLAPRLLHAAPGARAIYLNLRAEPYLATLLAGANSGIDLRGHGPERIRRLQARTTVPLGPLHALSPGELCALAWLAETRSQHDAVRANPDRVLAIDFDDFLADVTRAMTAIVGHLGITTDPRWLADVARNPALTRYSKAPEHAYGPEVRADVLREARRQHAAEIRRGLAWLDSIARTDPELGALISA